MGNYIKRILILFFIIGTFFYILIYFLRPTDLTMLEAIRFVVSPGRKYFTMGCTQIGLKNYNHAIDLFKKSANKDKNFLPMAITMIQSIGLDYETEGKYEKAIEIYDEIIKLDPANVEAYDDKAKVYKKKGLYSEAIAEWEKCIKIAPNSKWAIRAKRQILKLKGQDKKVEK